MTPTAQLSITEADRLLTTAVRTHEGRQDPYTTYARLRLGSPRWRNAEGAIVVSTYRDCLEVLRHPRLGRAEADMDLPASIGGRRRRSDDDPHTMLLLNPPDHTRIRGLVSREFTPRRVEGLRPVIEGLLDPVLDDFARNGGGELMSDLAMPFPVAVISELLGVPRDGNEHIQPMVRAVTAFIDAASSEDDIAEADAAVIELATFFMGLVEAKRAAPDDRLLSALISVEAEGDRLSIQELLANTLLLYAAGFETTSNLIGNGVRLLLAHPDQLELLRSTPELIPSAVLETLRADSPVQLNARFALSDVELFGETFPRGTAFTVLQGSANHDESVFDRSDEFDVTRYHRGDAAQPLSFGWGAHHCLGAHLARAEGEIILGALLDRFEEITLDVDALAAQTPPVSEPVYRPTFTLRGLETLPVCVA